MSQLCAGMKSQLILGGAITVVIVPVVIYATVVIVQSEGPKEGYCNIKSCRGKPHTMCEYPSTEVKKACGKCNPGLSKGEPDKILRTINKRRRSQKIKICVDGRLKEIGRLPDLKWNPEFAEVAQRWANQCPLEKDKCRNIPKMECGQTVDFVQSGIGRELSPMGMIDYWYIHNIDIVKKCKTRSQERTYARLYMTNVSIIGCGYLKCDHGEADFAYLVCNYGPVPDSHMEDKLVPPLKSGGKHRLQV